jgi:hypothetical protein
MRKGMREDDGLEARPTGEGRGEDDRLEAGPTEEKRGEKTQVGDLRYRGGERTTGWKQVLPGKKR